MRTSVKDTRRLCNAESRAKLHFMCKLNTHRTFTGFYKVRREIKGKCNVRCFRKTKQYTRVTENTLLSAKRAFKCVCTHLN